MSISGKFKLLFFESTFFPNFISILELSAITFTAEEMAEDEWNHCYSKKIAYYPDNRFNEKYWPPVKRIDNVYGDRNLFCACPPTEDYNSELKTG